MNHTNPGTENHGIVCKNKYLRSLLCFACERAKVEGAGVLGIGIIPLQY
jgi:hypothetical protein